MDSLAWPDRKSRLGGALLFAALILPVLIIATIGHQRTRQVMTDHALERRQSLALLAAAVLDEKFQRWTDLGVSLATRVQFRRLVAESRWEEAVQILADVPTNFTEIQRVFLADPDGVLRADYPALPGVRGRSFAERDWYRGVSRNWSPYVSVIYRRAAVPQWNVMAIAVPVRTESGSVVGILVLQASLDTLVTWCRSLQVGAGAYVYFVDSQGTVAGLPGTDPHGNLPSRSGDPIWEKVRRRESGVVFRGDGAAGESVIAYAPVLGLGGGVFVEQPSVEAFAARASAIRVGLLLDSLILVFHTLLAFLIVRFFGRMRAAERRIRVLNADLAARARDLESANREMESFSYSASHDLRAPLRAIQGMSVALEEDYGARLDATGREFLSRIRAGCRRMDTLIDDLLALAQVSRQEMTFEQVDLSEICRSVLVDLRRTQPDRPVDVRIESGLTVRGDPRLLRVMMENLLGNAWKYTSAHPQATIEVGRATLDGQPAVYVKDDGAGFDMARAERLFSAFHRMHSMDEFPGTGVGLATVHKILERHGGRITARAEVQKGACFTFTCAPGE